MDRIDWLSDLVQWLRKLDDQRQVEVQEGKVLASLGNKEYQIPQSLAVVWSEDILNVPGKPATRGFGGRIYFYNEKSQAISVEGELTVHGYDETFAKPGGVVSPEADKTFKFTPEQFTQHFSQSDLGASYSVWIPWDNGGYGKKIMLIPSFITKDGRLIRGEPSKVTLAGKSPTSQDVYGPSTVQQVSHTEPTNDQPLQRIQVATEDQGQMKTTTIRMPGNRRAPARSTPNITPMGSDSAFNIRHAPPTTFPTKVCRLPFDMQRDDCRANAGDVECGTRQSSQHWSDERGASANVVGSAVESAGSIESQWNQPGCSAAEFSVPCKHAEQVSRGTAGQLSTAGQCSADAGGIDPWSNAQSSRGRSIVERIRSTRDAGSSNGLRCELEWFRIPGHRDAVADEAAY